jgi:glycosyltransferase involved in cell wall biosynthesis
MKIAFIHDQKKIKTGAHFINDLIATKLKAKGIKVINFYPKINLIKTPYHLKGLQSILFFYSLLEHREKILKCDLIQGTTYTPLTFLAFPIPVVCHFGSTTCGFLYNTPRANLLNRETKKLWYLLKKEGIIKELNVKTRRPLRDIAEMENYVASKAEAVLAVSEKVKEELIDQKISVEKINVVHNAIEDFWFEQKSDGIIEEPRIVYLGRIGKDSFTMKLKGIDRLIHIYKRFEAVKKVTIGIAVTDMLKKYLMEIPNHGLFLNIKKDIIPSILSPLSGSILFIPSRYEGFSLSMVEGMSQGLIPVVYPVGVAPEIIRNGINGFIVHNQSEAESRIADLLANRQLRKELSEAARSTSFQFHSDIMIERISKVYESVLENKTNFKQYSFR